MKKAIHIVLAVMLICIGCQRNTDTLTGTWKAEKVEVDFDEKHSTPEIVKQAGSIEKENILILAADSSLTFISQGDTIKGRFSVRDTQVFLISKTFGIIKGNSIITDERMPFGNITVEYQKIQ